MKVRALTQDSEVLAAFPLMSVLRERLRADTFLAEVRRQERDGYRLLGGFDGEHLVALAGIRRSHTLSRGEHVFIDDFITEEHVRGQGHGRSLMLEVLALAAAEGVPRVYLDSRATAKGFYERFGFTFLTSLPCWIDVPAR